MNRKGLKILRRVNSKGEITLGEALSIGKSRRNSTHLDQYPLTLLIAGDYVGWTRTLRQKNSAGAAVEYPNASESGSFLASNAELLPSCRPT